MVIGIPKESLTGETRIAILPAEIKRLSSDNVTFIIEASAGTGSFISDEDYSSVGADIVSDVYSGSDLIVQINPPSEEELTKIKDGTTLVSLLAPFINHDLVKQLAMKNISSYCLELIPRSTYAQSMDVLSSQATVSGYRAVLNAATHMGKFSPCS